MLEHQPTLSARHKGILEVEGLRFRDLDGDGVLSPYEDWRLSARERAVDLRKRLSREQKAGLMIIGSQYMAGSPWVGPDGGSPDLSHGVDGLNLVPKTEGGSFLRREDGYSRKHLLTGESLETPRLHASSAFRAIGERHQRRFIVRDNPSAADLAFWANELQELAEQSEFGIPVVLTSNTRNHVGSTTTLGVSEAGGVFSEWPGELGLAALMDEQLMLTFAETARREWRAAGLHKLYGYMADVPSEPRWSRFDGTLGEDPETVSRLIGALVRGFQGERLGPDSVALTIKHFPGGGVRTEGHDPHFVWGQTNDYPTEGSLEQYHLPPFRAAIAAGVASVMPYYSKPSNASTPQLSPELHAGGGQFEEVAFAYNEQFLTDLLRNRLGFQGYVNTDSGVLEGMAWGVEDLTLAQRWAKLVRAGSDLVGDELDPSTLLEAIESGQLEEHELDRSVQLLLEEMFTLGLFENPYVDVARAEAVSQDHATRALGAAAQRRSVTLLRNDRCLLPLPTDVPSVYVEVLARTGGVSETAELRTAVAARVGAARVVDDPAEAAMAILWVQPSISLFSDDKPGSDISMELGERGVDVARVLRIQEAVPTVLVLNLINPWVIADVEPSAAAVAATYGISPANLVAVLFGDDAPGGRLPLTVPRSDAVISASARDVPGMFAGVDYAYVDSAGAVYRYGFGIDVRSEHGAWCATGRRADRA